MGVAIPPGRLPRLAVAAKPSRRSIRVAVFELQPTAQGTKAPLLAQTDVPDPGGAASLAWVGDRVVLCTTTLRYLLVAPLAAGPSRWRELFAVPEELAHTRAAVRGLPAAGRALLLVGQAGVFVDAWGSPVGSSLRLDHLAAQPGALAASALHALVICADGVHVFDAETGELVQHLAFGGGAPRRAAGQPLLAGDSPTGAAVAVAGAQGVWLCLPVSLEQQVRELLLRREYGRGLELTDQGFRQGAPWADVACAQAALLLLHGGSIDAAVPACLLPRVACLAPPALRLLPAALLLLPAALAPVTTRRLHLSGHPSWPASHRNPKRTSLPPAEPCCHQAVLPHTATASHCHLAQCLPRPALQTAPLPWPVPEPLPPPCHCADCRFEEAAALLERCGPDAFQPVQLLQLFPADMAPWLGLVPPYKQPYWALHPPLAALEVLVDRRLAILRGGGSSNSRRGSSDGGGGGVSSGGGGYYEASSSWNGGLAGESAAAAAGDGGGSGQELPPSNGTGGQEAWDAHRQPPKQRWQQQQQGQQQQQQQQQQSPGDHTGGRSPAERAAAAAGAGAGAGAGAEAGSAVAQAQRQQLLRQARESLAQYLFRVRMLGGVACEEAVDTLLLLLLVKLGGVREAAAFAAVPNGVDPAAVAPWLQVRLVLLLLLLLVSLWLLPVSPWLLRVPGLLPVPGLRLGLPAVWLSAPSRREAWLRLCSVSAASASALWRLHAASLPVPAAAPLQVPRILLLSSTAVLSCIFPTTAALPSPAPSAAGRGVAPRAGHAAGRAGAGGGRAGHLAPGGGWGPGVPGSGGAAGGAAGGAGVGRSSAQRPGPLL